MTCKTTLLRVAGTAMSSCMSMNGVSSDKAQQVNVSNRDVSLSIVCSANLPLLHSRVGAILANSLIDVVWDGTTRTASSFGAQDGSDKL